MANFVKSVEYLEITLTGSAAVSANLGKGQAIADCVPFYTVNCNASVGNQIADRYVEVFFESGPNRVTAQRDGANGTVIVGVFVVEFDTSIVTVQQGTWTMSSTNNTTETITAVTQTKAFILIAYRDTSTFGDWARAEIKVQFDSDTVLGFDKVTAGGVVTGRYYVVSTAGTDFSVQHITISPASADETATASITSVTLAETFVINTYQTDHAGNDVLNGAWCVDLSAQTTVRARRAFDSFGGSPGAAVDAAVIETQIVSAGGPEFSVERNECDWGDSLTEAVTITSIDQAKAIVVAGGHQGVMNSTELTGGEIDGNYAILDFTADTTVTGTRGVNTDPDGTTAFEVVEFVLAAGMERGIGRGILRGVARGV